MDEQKSCGEELVGGLEVMGECSWPGGAGGVEGHSQHQKQPVGTHRARAACDGTSDKLQMFRPGGAD